MKLPKSTIKLIVMAVIGVFLIPALSLGIVIFLYNGGGTFWKKIDFPYPVISIIKLDESEFWIYTENQEIYHGFYPCDDKADCFEKTDIVHGFSEDTLITRGECPKIDKLFIYPIFDKIEICASFKFVTLLAITDKQELWIWDKAFSSANDFLFYIYATFLILEILFLFVMFLIFVMQISFE